MADAIQTDTTLATRIVFRVDARALVSAGLLLGSAALQQQASLERWIVARAVQGAGAGMIEDHRYDYSFPADPWLNVGVAAQLFGLGLIMLAAGIMVLGLAAAARSNAARAPLFISGGLVAGVCALLGVHALLSGIVGVPTPLGTPVVQLVLGVIQFGALAAFTVSCARRSSLWLVACLLLFATTVPGYLVATFALAPAVAGHQSYDTTPWTESIIAAFIAMSACAVLVSGFVRRRRDARPRGSIESGD